MTTKHLAISKTGVDMDREEKVGLAITILFFLLFPFIAIWSANTLFPSLAIPYTWKTWLAAFFLGLFIRPNYKGN